MGGVLLSNREHTATDCEQDGACLPHGKIPPQGFLLKAYFRFSGILERVFLEKRTPKFAISLVEVNGLCNSFAESC